MPADLLATLGVLPVLEPLDGLVGDAVVAALLQFPVVRVSAERPVPVGGQQAGVLLVVGEVLLLGAADLALAVGGPVENSRLPSVALQAPSGAGLLCYRG